MKKIVLFSFFAIVTYAALLTGCKAKVEGTIGGADSTKTVKADMPSAERGKYLVTAVAGCNDCHTPLKMGQMGPEPDMTRMLSGHPEPMKMPPSPKMDMPWMASTSATLTAWTGPWGISYTTNLTPDSATGIGKWDETTFMLTLRNGKHIGTGRPLLPPMPWQTFKNMTDNDLKSIYAYLRTIPPIHNQVPEAIVAPQPGPPMSDAKK